MFKPGDLVYVVMKDYLKETYHIHSGYIYNVVMDHYLGKKCFYFYIEEEKQARRCYSGLFKKKKNAQFYIKKQLKKRIEELKETIDQLKEDYDRI